MPTAPTQLHPIVPDYSRLKEKEETIRNKQKDNFDSRHRSKELTPFSPGENVWVTDQQTPGTVVQLSSPWFKPHLECCIETKDILGTLPVM